MLEEEKEGRGVGGSFSGFDFEEDDGDRPFSKAAQLFSTPFFFSLRLFPFFIVGFLVGFLG